MTARDLTTHATAAVVALAASIAVAGMASRRPPAKAPVPSAGAPPAVVVDATGHPVRVRPFQRIASASTVADRLLVDLAEPHRIAAHSTQAAANERTGHLYRGRPLIRTVEDVEAVLALKPDLLLVNAFLDASRIARLREAGLEVFDLGEMRGLVNLIPNIHAIAALLGAPERGRQYAETFLARLRRVAAPLGAGRRPTALYVAVYADKLFGGTRGTGYHDVITHAGLVDAAAERFRDWPHYTHEELLSLDPEVVLTKAGMARALCGQPGLDRLRVCAGRGKIVELPGRLLDDPGPAILDAAELLYQAVHGGMKPPDR